VSSDGHFIATKNYGPNVVLLVLMEGALNGAFKGTCKGKFERYSSLVNLRGESGAHEAPYVALLIWSVQRGLGESPGAHPSAAPLEIE